MKKEIRVVAMVMEAGGGGGGWGVDPGVVPAITQPVGEMDCVALKLIAVWAEAAQISNIEDMGSHQFDGC